MIAAAKDRKPGFVTHSPQIMDRRVSFAVPTTEETTEEITQPLSALQYPARYAPPLAPPLYGARDGFWIPKHPYYAPIMAPMPSPSGALLRSPLPLPMGLFGQQYMMPPRPYWIEPVPRSESFKPFQDADYSSEEQSDSRAKSVLLRTVGIGAVLLALLTVLISVLLTIDWQGPSVLSATSELPLPVEHVHSSGVNVPLPLNSPEKPAEVRRADAVHATAKPRKAAHHERPGTTALHRDAPASKKRHPLQNSSNRTRQLPQQCGRRFYTYCHRQKNQTFYSSLSRTCVSTAVDNVHVCNRGENRFSSLGSCLSNCVRVAKGRESDRCHESTLFTECSRQDMLETWWIFDGSACSKWTFPLGNCPSQGARVFRSRRECDAECQRPNRNDTAYAHHCDAPVTATCSPEQIKYPYFADMTLKGNARCVMTSQRELRIRRCLIGSNKFGSVRSCEKVCVHS